MPRTLDLWDTLQNLQVLSQPDTTTPLAEVDDFLPVADAVALADSATVVNGAHSGTYVYDNATSKYGAAQYS
jgi:hypothetical protein